MKSTSGVERCCFGLLCQQFTNHQAALRTLQDLAFWQFTTPMIDIGLVEVEELNSSGIVDRHV